MAEKRTEPRLHCWQRPVTGAYVSSACTTPGHLRAVFAAERARLAAAAAAGAPVPGPQGRLQPLETKPCA